MPDLDSDIYTLQKNRELFITDSIISTLNLMQKHVKRSFYQIIDNIFLLLQEPIVAVILRKYKDEEDLKKIVLEIGEEPKKKENHKNEEALKKREKYVVVYTTVSDPELSSHFIEDLKENVSLDSLLEMRVRQSKNGVDPGYFVVLAKANYTGLDRKKKEYPNYEPYLKSDDYCKTVENVIKEVANYINRARGNDVSQIKKRKKQKRQKETDQYYDYLKEPLDNLEKSYYTPPEVNLVNVSSNLKKEIEDKREFVIKELTAVLKNIFADECEGSPLIRREQNPSLANIFCVLKMLLLNSNKLRREHFNYTTRFVFSDDQRESIRAFLAQNKKTTCKECKECVFPEDNKSIKAFIEQLEAPVGLEARSISDYVFHSGALEFTNVIPGTGRLDTGGDEKDAKREARKYCFFRRIVLHADKAKEDDESKVAVWLIPIRIYGVPWLNFFVVNSKANYTWGMNYQIFRKIYPKLARNMRRGITELFLKEIKIVFKGCLEENLLHDLKKMTDILNDRCCVYEFIFPFPRLSFVPPEKNIPDDSPIKLGEGKIIYFHLDPNNYFSQQIHEYPGFTDSLREKIKSKLQSVANEDTKDVNDSLLKVFKKSHPHSHSELLTRTLKTPILYKIDENKAENTYRFIGNFKRYKKYCDQTNVAEIKVVLVKGEANACELFVQEFVNYFHYKNTVRFDLKDFDFMHATGLLKSELTLQEKSEYFFKYDNLHLANFKKGKNIFLNERYQKKLAALLGDKNLIISGEDIDKDLLSDHLKALDFYIFRST